MDYYARERPVEAPDKVFINMAKYSPDGRYIALVGADKHISILNTDTYNLKQSIDCTKYTRIRDIDFPNHGAVIGAAADNVLALFGNPSGKTYKAITPDRLTHNFKHVQFGNDNVLVGTTTNYYVYIYYDYTTPDLKNVRFFPRNVNLTSINFITHSLIITAFDDGVCLKWNSTEADLEKEYFEIHQHDLGSSIISHSTMSPDNMYVLLTHLPNKLSSWRIDDTVARSESNQRIITFFKIYTGINATARDEFAIKGKFMFNGDDKFVIAGSENFMIYIWRFETAEVLRTLTCYGSVPYSIIFNPSSENFEEFAILQRNGELFVWKRRPIAMAACSSSSSS